MRRRVVAFAFAALLFGSVQACVVGGPRPEAYGETLRALPTVPVCQYRYEGSAAAGRGRAVVTCEGDARVDDAELKEAGLAEARSMNPDGSFVVLAEVTHRVDQLGMQCEAVPILPWSRAGLVDRRWKRRVCSLVPAGPPGHSLELVVQSGGLDGAS